MKRAALLLFLASLSYASLVWQFSTDGAVNAKPLVFQGMLIVASDDGNVYALDPAAGARMWQAQAGRRPNEAIAFDNGIAVSTTGGRVVKLDRLGRTLWSVNLNVSRYNVSYLYGAAAGTRGLFVTADTGVYFVEKNSTVRRLVEFDDRSLATAPVAGPDYAIYGQNNTLYKVRENGAIEWKASIGQGSFWARPALDGTFVYAGGLDGSMHAYSISNGGRAWEARTRSWVMGTPLIKDGMAYFGSNDGNVYAVNIGSGSVEWKAPTTLAVYTEPEAGAMGGRSVIFAGDSDKSTYAISSDTGEVVWKGSAAGSVGSPLFYQNLVIFGSEDKRVYAYSTERACSITSPREGSVLGMKEVVVEGRHVSQAGGASVWVNINSAGWERTNTSGSGWTYYVDPKEKFRGGINVISCKVVDNSGEETGNAFTSVAVNHDPNIPLSTLVVTVSPTLLENAPFTVYVNDGDDGSPVDRFTLTIAGKDVEASKNVTLQMPAGQYDVTVKKIGFGDAAVRLNVSASGMNPLYLGVGGVLILIIGWRAISSMRRAKRK